MLFTELARDLSENFLLYRAQKNDIMLNENLTLTRFG